MRAFIREVSGSRLQHDTRTLLAAGIALGGRPFGEAERQDSKLKTLKLVFLEFDGKMFAVRESKKSLTFIYIDTVNTTRALSSDRDENVGPLAHGLILAQMCISR